jgi:hypothetical protein
MYLSAEGFALTPQCGYYPILWLFTAEKLSDGGAF